MSVIVNHRHRRGRAAGVGSWRSLCPTPRGAETGPARAAGFRSRAHRQEADAHATRAQELGPEADALRRAAAEKAAVAEQEAASAEALAKRATKAEQEIAP
jgi:hypothetical protein